MLTGGATAASTLTVTGAATLNGDVDLGDESTDTITLGGPLASLEVTGAVDLQGAVTLGDESTDAITVNGDATAAGSLTVAGGLRKPDTLLSSRGQKAKC